MIGKNGVDPFRLVERGPEKRTQSLDGRVVYRHPRLIVKIFDARSATVISYRVQRSAGKIEEKRLERTSEVSDRIVLQIV